MKEREFKVVAVFVVLVCLGAIAYLISAGEGIQKSPIEGAPHPRLFFEYSDIQPLIDRMNADPYVDDAFNILISRADLALAYTSSAMYSSSFGIHYIDKLALAYVFSDNWNTESYGDKCKELTLYAANDNHFLDCSGWEEYYNESELLYTLNIGYDFCYDKFSDVEKQQILDRMVEVIDVGLNGQAGAGDCQYQRVPPTVPNKAAMTAGMFGLTYLNIYDDTLLSQGQRDILDDGRALAEDIIDNNLLKNSFGEDGSYSEGMLYLMWSYRFLVPYFEARERLEGYSYYDNYPEIRNSIKWITYNFLPSGNGATNNFNDASDDYWLNSPLRIHNTYMDWVVSKDPGSNESKLARWLWSHVYGENSDYTGRMQNTNDISTILWYDSNIPLENPENFLDNSGYFDHGGWYFYRTGWQDGVSSNDVMFEFYSGKFFGGHNQEDKNQFTLYEGNSLFFVDGGPGVPYYETQYHNLFLIDDVGQITQTNGCGSDGNITDYFYSSGLDFLVGDNSYAYANFSDFNDASSWCNNENYNTVEKSDRGVLVIKDFSGKPYFIMVDDIKKDNQIRDYSLKLQNSPNTLYTLVDPISLRKNSKNLSIHFINPRYNLLDVYNTSNSETSVLNVDYTDDQAYFVYALMPFDSPIYSAEYLDVNGGYGIGFSQGDIVDVILVNDGVASMSYGSVFSNSKAVYLRYNNGALIEFSVLDGTNLVVNGIDYLDVAEPTSVYSNFSAIYVQDLVDQTIYGPNVDTVYLGREEVQFIDEGNYIHVGNTCIGPEVPDNDIDEDCDGSIEYTINLNPGWNLISFPFEPVDDFSAFSNANIDKILTFGNGWNYWFEGEGNLDTLEFGKGYFVYSNSNQVLTFSGQVQENEIVLFGGLELIGVKNPIVVSDLAPNPGLVNGVWEYDRINNIYEELTVFDTLLPKKGYWISYGDAQGSPPLPPG